MASFPDKLSQKLASDVTFSYQMRYKYVPFLGVQLPRGAARCIRQVRAESVGVSASTPTVLEK